MLLRLGYSTKETSASPSNETSSNPVEHIAGLDHEQRSSRLHKDGEPRNHHDSPPTLMGWTPCLNARHPPTQTNPLLGACIWKETTSSHMSSIQGSTEKHRLEKSSPQKKKKSVSVENAARLIEETKRVQRKASAPHLSNHPTLHRRTCQ